MHLQDPEPKSWLQQRIEGLGKEISFTKEGRKAILNKLIESEGFEKFLHVKYMGTKRFGLDGGESMVPALEPESLSIPTRVRSDRSVPGAPCSSKNSQSVPVVLTWIHWC